MCNIVRTTARISIYDRVTTKIIQDLEDGTRPWIKPWKDTARTSLAIRPHRHDGQPYRGINTLILWSEAAERGYHSSCWMTYRQAQSLGAQVRKGETAATIVYAGQVGRTEQDVESSENVEKTTRFLRSYSVFNADQINGLADDIIKIDSLRPTPDVATKIERADAFVTATGAAIRTGGNRACYIPSLDRIDMPVYARFIDTPTSTAAESYYATLFHEIIHWTSPSGRCDRQLGKRFGDQAYAGEELVAEIGAAFLCAELGVSLQPRPDTAAYIASWLKVLKADNRAIFSAAAFAQKALDWLAATTIIDTGVP
jgi:antirestriction protein ArdC